MPPHPEGKAMIDIPFRIADHAGLRLAAVNRGKVRPGVGPPEHGELRYNGL